MTGTFLRLPFTFDRVRLEADLKACTDTAWPQHFNQQDFSGNWTSIALRSISGDPFDIHSIPGKAYQDTFLMEKCSYFREVLEQFKCEMETVRLLNLGAGGIIHEHRDPAAGYDDDVLRIHIPVTTNEKTTMTVDGVTLHLQAGECWYADFSKPHSVRNDGDTDRVHLVIDGLRNAWTDEIFARAGYDFEAEKERKKPAREIVLRMIEELRLQNTPGALQLAANLEREHNLRS